MTQPTTEQPQPTRQQLRQQIERHCWDIRRDWAFMHQPLSTGSVAARVSRSAGTGEEDSDGNHGVTRVDVIVSARADVTIILNGWCRVAIEDYNITEVIPDGTDVPAMCRFLERWAIQLAAHDAVADMIDELADCARVVHRTAFPEKRTTLSIGDCPLRLEDNNICGGKVVALPDEDAGESYAVCRSCGERAVVSWWEREMFGPEASHLLTATELRTFIHQQFGKLVTEATIRQWIKRGIIESSGKAADGRTLYDRGAVAYALQQRIAV